MSPGRAPAQRKLRVTALQRSALKLLIFCVCTRPEDACCFRVSASIAPATRPVSALISAFGPRVAFAFSTDGSFGPSYGFG